MFSSKRISIGAVMFSTVLALASSAQASVVSVAPMQTFNFAGNCTDCVALDGTTTARAILKLTADYTSNQQISSQNFVSFEYKGSDKLAAYTINQSNLNEVFGHVSAASGGGDVFSISEFQPIFIFYGLNIFSTSPSNHFFNLQEGGNWVTGQNNFSDDEGNGGDFTQPTAAAVPEPASLALLGLGLLGLAAARRKSLR